MLETCTVALKIEGVVTKYVIHCFHRKGLERRKYNKCFSICAPESCQHCVTAASVKLCPQPGYDTDWSGWVMHQNPDKQWLFRSSQRQQRPSWLLLPWVQAFVPIHSCFMIQPSFDSFKQPAPQRAAVLSKTESYHFHSELITSSSLTLTFPLFQLRHHLLKQPQTESFWNINWLKNELFGYIEAVSQTANPQQFYFCAYLKSLNTVS